MRVSVNPTWSKTKIGLKGCCSHPPVGRSLELIGDNKPRKMIVKYRTPLIDLLIFIDTNGNMAQLVEQLTVNQWVTGSSPVIPAICWCGSTVEQLTCNQQVVGSIPITSSK